MNIDKSPLVSVVIPNYNHAPYLPKRIESVLSQTYQNFEIIILDDKSTDASQEVILNYANKDSRIITVFNKINSGSTFKQWNKGAKLAKGDFLWIAESDDYADKLFLEKMLPVLIQHEHIGLVYCMSSKVDENDQLIGDAVPRDNPNLDPSRWERDFIVSGQQECANVMIFKNVIANASGVLFRKSALLEAGGAAEDLKLCGDWLTYVKILSLSDVAYKSDYLNFFRVHSGTVRKKRSFNSFDAIWERYQVFKQINQNFQISKKNAENATVRLATDFFRHKENLRLLFIYKKQRNVFIKDFISCKTKYGIIRGLFKFVINKLRKVVSRKTTTT